MQLWVFLNPLTWKEYNKEGQQGANPYTLPPTNLRISILPAPQLDVKKNAWKKKQDKQERRRKLLTGKLEGDLSFTLSIFFH